MYTWLGRMPWALAWLFFSASSFAAPPSADQIQSWVRQLDADDFALRERAAEQLTAAGDAAIEALGDAVIAHGAERSWRAVTTLEQIALGGNKATLERVATVLEKLSEQGKPGLARLAKDLYAKRTQARRDRAVEKVRALGGKFNGEVAHLEIVQQLQAPHAGVDVALNAVNALLVNQPAVALPDPPPDLPEDEILPVGEAPLAAVGEGFIGEAFVSPLLAHAVESNESDASLTIDQDWRGSDADLAVLGELPHVTSLSLRRAPLSDAAVAQIAALPRLAAVEVDGTPITPAALNKLRQQRPHVHVYARGNAMLGILADMSGPCRVTGVVQDSGAAQAGLQEGDEIVAIESLPVRDFSDLTIAIFGRRAGEKLRLECNRDGNKLSVDVVLQERQH
jgi:hypothetical protein